MRKLAAWSLVICLTGAIPLANALAQQTETTEPATLEQADLLAQAAVSACSPATPGATAAAEACRAALDALSATVARLVVQGEISETNAIARFQQVRDNVRTADGGAVIDALFQELFPETQDTGVPSPA